MEENPSTQSSHPPAGPDVPRSRTPRADFSAPEPAQPKGAPAERGSRRSGAKAAPPVTFQPPSGEDEAEAGRPRPSRTATPKPKPPAGTPAASTAAPAQTPAPRAGRNAQKRGSGAKPFPPPKADSSTDAMPARRADAPAQPTLPGTAAAPPASGAVETAGAADPGATTETTAPAQPATTAESKATPAKATGRKAASRNPGIAARTEITPAKAFPQHAEDTQQSRTTQGTAADAVARPVTADAPALPGAGGASAATAARTTPTKVPDRAAKVETPAQQVTAAPARKPARRSAKASGSSAAAPDAQPVTPESTSAPVELRVPHQPLAEPAPPQQATAETKAATSRTEPEPAAEPDDEQPETPERPAAVATIRGAAGTVDKAAATATGTAVQLRRIAAETWSGVAADPGHTAEVLALAAVRAIGPRAAEWARSVRESYPTAGADGIAQMAVRQFTRRGGVSSALASVAGAYAPAALLATTAYHHAELVLHVAAAYGQDPSDPARAADLLVLTRVHASREDAEAALAATQEPGTQGGGTGTAWRLGRTLAAQAGGWVALRAVSRFFPGTTMVVAAVTSRAATETLGVRARTYFTNDRSEPTAR